MKLYILQFVTAGSMLIRVAIMLAFGGTETLGTYSIILSLITLFGLPIQIYCNQAVQVKIIKMKNEKKLSIYKVLFLLGILLSFIDLLIILCFNRFFGSINAVSAYSLWSKSVIITIIISYVTAVFDLYSLTNDRIFDFFVASCSNAVISMIASFIILYFFSKKYIVIVPVFSFLAVLIYYLIIYSNQYRKLFSTQILTVKKNELVEIYELFKESWTYNLIMISTSISDYIIKSILIKTNGSGLVGEYQTIVGIEAIVGNVFLSPFYRNLLISASKEKHSTKSKLYKSVTEGALIASIPAIGFVFVALMKSYIPYKTNLLNILWPLAFIVSIRVLWAVWGTVAQYLLAAGRIQFVTIVEVSNRLLIAIIFIITASLFRLWGYVIACAIVGLGLLVVVIRIIKSDSDYFNNEQMINPIKQNSI